MEADLGTTDVLARNAPAPYKERLREQGLEGEGDIEAALRGQLYQTLSWKSFLALTDDDCSCLNLLDLKMGGLLNRPEYIT